MDRIKKLVDCMEQFNNGDISAETYAELSFKVDLPFHQKLIQFRSVHFIKRQIIQKIRINENVLKFVSVLVSIAYEVINSNTMYWNIVCATQV